MCFFHPTTKSYNPVNDQSSCNRNPLCRQISFLAHKSPKIGSCRFVLPSGSTSVGLSWRSSRQINKSSKIQLTILISFYKLFKSIDSDVSRQQTDCTSEKKELLLIVDRKKKANKMFIDRKDLSKS